ncbi:MAG: ferritin-like domain-containing protein [Leptospiraceae bacterium]|nr:ferritin-like domain-containing protein [Leptospiraceae bacterium]MCP5499885.1 ferritin-like domain-containing protein [Leptospiraceae bacterium]
MDNILNDVSQLSQMAFRNAKVAADLFPSAFSGFILKESQKDRIGIHSGHKVWYDWKYDNKGSAKFSELYKKAKKGQWDSDDLPWNTSVDPFSNEIPIFPEKLFPIYGSKAYNVLDKKEKAKLTYELISVLLSQGLHGEQGALYASAITVEATPWIDAKYYGATQVMDEGRHVEVFYRYVDEKLNNLYHINDNLYVVIHALTEASDWDLKFLGMQIMIEGLALGAFSLIYKYTKEPLLRELLKNVISDEARHVHYGVEALRDYYTKEISESKRREREDWAYEVALLLRNRFLFTEFYDQFFGHAMTKEQWNKYVLESEVMSEFRRTLFSRLIPNLKAIGLLSDRIRPRYEELGVLRYENEKAADTISLHELLLEKEMGKTSIIEAA